MIGQINIIHFLFGQLSSIKIADTVGNKMNMPSIIPFSVNTKDNLKFTVKVFTDMISIGQYTFRPIYVSRFFFTVSQDKVHKLSAIFFAPQLFHQVHLLYCIKRINSISTNQMGFRIDISID